MPVSWNLTRGVKKFSAADVLIFSVGKSGRTWLRVLLNKYLSLHYATPFELGELHRLKPEIPAIRFDHELWSYHNNTSWIKRLMGDNICPDSIRRRKKIVVIHRDPRDVVVSLYFHSTKRGRRKRTIEISDFIKTPYSGVEDIVTVMNAWYAQLNDHPACLWIGYEAMKADAAGELKRLLEFIGIADIDPHKVDQAVEFAHFDNMKQLEATNALGSRILRPRDISDPDSYKVREGSVGGYRKHFEAEDLSYLDRAVGALACFYGYSVQLMVLLWTCPLVFQ